MTPKLSQTKANKPGFNLNLISNALSPRQKPGMHALMLDQEDTRNNTGLMPEGAYSNRKNTADGFKTSKKESSRNIKNLVDLHSSDIKSPGQSMRKATDRNPQYKHAMGHEQRRMEKIDSYEEQVMSEDSPFQA